MRKWGSLRRLVSKRAQRFFQFAGLLDLSRERLLTQIKKALPFDPIVGTEAKEGVETTRLDYQRLFSI